jgi:glycosyltransferase involved in cell wall biosynthesis
MLSGRKKILIIGNYPPPMCGWAIQTKLAVDELRRRGYLCEVLKLNENRDLKDPAYIDVQSPWDYACKVIAHCLRGFSVNAHVNGMSLKGYAAAAGALTVARILNRSGMLTFHGGLSQRYFPRHDVWWIFHSYRTLFRLASAIACDSEEIRNAICGYGIEPQKVIAIEAFSDTYTSFTPAVLSGEMEAFLGAHEPAIFCYVSFRPEYRLSDLRRCIAEYRLKYPRAGFVWIGFPDKEIASARAFLASWDAENRNAVLLLPNVEHDRFLTLMTRCLACLRTPACDGVAASVLEALALGIPVVASENGRRPASVITYADGDVRGMCAKLIEVTERYNEVKAAIDAPSAGDNVSLMANWLVHEPVSNNRSRAPGAR